jgi:hypothetical protein
MSFREKRIATFNLDPANSMEAASSFDEKGTAS